jgi:hypothetical protein
MLQRHFVPSCLRPILSPNETRRARTERGGARRWLVGPSVHIRDEELRLIVRDNDTFSI